MKYCYNITVHINSKPITYAALEEARADLFGLYYCADPIMVELGIMPDMEAYKAAYANFIRNGLMSQLSRIELGKNVTESHMQDRKLISEWCYEKGKAENVIEKIDFRKTTFGGSSNIPTTTEYSISEIKQLLTKCKYCA